MLTLMHGIVIWRICVVIFRKSSLLITLNLRKCEFGKRFVKFVGHIVGSSLKSADQAKLEAIKLIPRPTNQKELKSFLGMLAYHRCYIPQFYELAKPLTDLTSVKYNKLLPWLPEHVISFCALKE